MAPSRKTRSVALSALSCALFPFTAWAAGQSLPNDGQGRIYGGEIAKNCEFPTTVATGGCTGTLIHPKVVISAAHCGTLKTITFGESMSKGAKKVGVKWCEKTSWGSTDAQICVLNEAIEGLPIAPIIQGCETEALKPNTKVTLAGFGLDENDYNADGSRGVDEKRWVETQINRIDDKLLHIGGGGKGGCQGDSGGPVYLQLEDGTWRTIGATHGGGSHPNCDEGMYKRTDKIFPWYEEQIKKHKETDIDLSPCFNDAGEWEPTEACGGFTKEVKGPFGAWSNNCGEGMPVVKYSATCGEPFGKNDDEGGDEGGGSQEDPKKSGEASGDSGSSGGDASEEQNPKSDKDESGETKGDASTDPDSSPEASPEEDEQGDSGTPDKSSDSAKGGDSSGEVKDPGGCELTAKSLPISWMLFAFGASAAWRRKRQVFRDAARS